MSLPVLVRGSHLEYYFDDIGLRFKLIFIILIGQLCLIYSIFYINALSAGQRYKIALKEASS